MCYYSALKLPLELFSFVFVVLWEIHGNSLIIYFSRWAAVIQEFEIITEIILSLIATIAQDKIVQNPLTDQVICNIIEAAGGTHNDLNGQFKYTVSRGKIITKSRSTISVDIKTCQLSFNKIIYDPEERECITAVLLQIKDKFNSFILTPIFWRGNDEKLLIKADYAEGKNLNYCLEHFKYRMPEEIVIFFTAQIALGLDFLHRNGVVHGDLTLKNILLFKDGYIKINDFSSSLVSKVKSSLRGGTLEYMAPEVLLGKLCDSAVDWWSLGICMSILMGLYPFDINRVKDSIILDQPILPLGTSPGCRTFIQALLTKNQNERLSHIYAQERDFHNFAVFGSTPWKDLAEKKLPPPFNIKYVFTDNFYYSVDI